MVFTGVSGDSAQQTTSTNTSNVDRDELLSQLGTLNLYFNTLTILLVGVLLNLYYIYRSRVDLLDIINGTDCGANMPNVTKIPEFTNLLFLYITAVFLVIDYNNYVNKTSVPCEDRDEVAIAKAYNSLFAALLAYIASIINRRNYDIDNSVSQTSSNEN